MPIFSRPIPSNRLRRYALIAQLGWWLPCGVFLGGSLIATSATADQGSAAQALFEAGAKARDNNDFETACEKFEASLSLDPAPGTTLNIADCREHLGQLAQAWQRYTEAAERLPVSDPRAEYAASKATELRTRVPEVTLEWSGVEDRAKISLDGEALPQGVVGIPLPVDPGKHVYVVQANGYEDAQFTIKVGEGQKETLSIGLGPAVVDPPQLSAQGTAFSTSNSMVEDTPARSHLGRTLGWIGVGVGGAALITGAVTGLVAMNKAKTVNDDCDEDFCRTDDGKKAADAGRVLSTVSTVSFIAGGVLAATGVTLLLLETRSAQKTTTASVAGPRASLLMQLSLQAAPTYSALRFTGAF